ncbi:zinc-binding dehydrogenase [Iamia sp. SCSIO 61187]|uniref:zinc-binding dehydrogenase n=1 Tax=Iamia sp. SCSIO 61187 TaxID=2722752 RepID=UPI001C630CB9|nr:zinc-binding dehydrogenase [Iamia sp. SCSIO 61187]QYG93171.1 zinc-binding dehydrogenase [Iamia sp. SCSIO 61187]
MRAVRVVRHGEPGDAIEVRDDVPEPDVGPGKVRVAVSAASLNFGDIARCRGGVAAVMAEPPFTLGMDVCGVVDAVGDGGDEGLVGRRVVGMADMSLGGLADLAVCGTVFDAPPGLDDVEAASFTLPFHLGYLALHERAALQPGEHVLVRSGASAVGTAAIQLAVAAGAHVVATAGSADKATLCSGLGAERVVDHSRDDVFDAVMEHTDGHGADVIFDPIGGDETETMWTCAARGGRYLPVGFNDDPESGLTGRPLRKVSMANVSVVGVVLAYLDAPLDFRRFGINPFPPSTGRRVHAALLDLVEQGAIRAVVGRRIGLSEVAAALEDHAARRTAGRTVADLAREGAA